MSNLLSDKKVKLRKGRRCDECGCQLFKGEIINRAICTGDEGIWSHYMCAPCEWAWETNKEKTRFPEDINTGEIVIDQIIKPIEAFLRKAS